MAALAAPAFAEGLGVPPPAPQPQEQQDMQAMPPQQAGNVLYVSGGIGDDELDAMKAQASQYNFRMINSDRTGHYAADTEVMIQGRDGGEVLHLQDAGPLLYVRLPPGSYKVTASNSGQQQAKNIKVSASMPTNVHLIWN